MTVLTFRLGDVAEQITDGTHLSPNYVDSGIPMLDSKHIKNDFSIDDSDAEKFISIETDKQLAQRCKPIAGDILISSRGTIGKIAIVKDGQNFNIMGNMILVRLGSSIDKRYFLHYLRRSLEYLVNLARGVAQKGLYLNQVRDLEITIPPLAEQQRIAALLDAADRILKQRESAIAKLDQLAQSVFVDMFQKHIKKLKLKDTCSFISGGTPSKDEPKFWNGDVAWISSADIEGDNVKEVRHFVTESAINNSATNPILPNNILVVTRTGVGKVVVTDRKFCFSQDITGLVLKKEFMPEFIAASLRNKRDEIVKQARGATIKGVTRDVIANVEIPAASFLEQQKFSVKILQIDSLKKNYEIDRIKINVLLSSLQHQSFAVN